MRSHGHFRASQGPCQHRPHSAGSRRWDVNKYSGCLWRDARLEGRHPSAEPSCQGMWCPGCSRHPLVLPPLQPAPILPALALAVPGSSSSEDLPYLNKITYIKNTESWRADSVCLNIYPCSDQALCSHDSTISTWHIYGLPGCWAPHAVCPGTTNPPPVSPLCLPVHPVVTPGLATISSLAHPCWAVLELPGVSRAGHGREWVPHLFPAAQEVLCREVPCPWREGSAANSLLSKNLLLLLLLHMGTEGPGARGHREVGMEQGCSSSLLHIAVLPCDVALLGSRALGTARPAARGGPGAAPPAPRGSVRSSVSGGIAAVSGRGLVRSRRRGAAQRGSP